MENSVYSNMAYSVFFVLELVSNLLASKRAKKTSTNTPRGPGILLGNSFFDGHWTHFGPIVGDPRELKTWQNGHQAGKNTVSGLVLVPSLD